MRIPGYRPTPEDVHKLADLIKQNQGNKVGGQQGTDKTGGTDGTQSTSRRESGCFGNCKQGVCNAARALMTLIKKSFENMMKGIPEYKIVLVKPGEPQFKNPNREGKARLL